MRLIGIDPGKVTGLCSINVDEEGILNSVEHFEFDHMAIGHYMEQVYNDWRKFGNKPIIIIESFTITQATAKNSQAPWSLETIGLVRYFSAKADIHLEFVNPSSHKSLVTKDLLNLAGLWYPSKGGHANDAASVVMWYTLTSLGLHHELLKESLSGKGNS